MGQERHTKLRDEIGPIKDYKEYFKFTFVRNPWDRMVSYFLFKKKNETTLASLTLNQFLNPCRWCKVPSSQVIFLRIGGKGGSIGADFVGRFENIEEDFQELCSQIFDHIGMEVDKENYPKLIHSNKSKRKKLYSDYYNESTKAKAKRLFPKDLQEFGYKFEGKLKW